MRLCHHVLLLFITKAGNRGQVRVWDLPGGGETILIRNIPDQALQRIRRSAFPG
jgi:hypothetical protein